MDKSSLKSGYIRGRALHRIGGKSHFSNRIHSFMDGPTLPIPILVGLHFIEAVIDANGLIHASGCSTEQADLQRTFANILTAVIRTTIESRILLTEPQCMSMRAAPSSEKPHAHAWRFCRITVTAER